MATEILEERPPYVSFHREAVENKARSLQEGRYVAVDVDFAHITPHYTKDVLIKKVATWLTQLEIDVNNGRFKAEWLELYKRQYAAWKNGQEIPLDGTPIKGWGILSPAQQETLIRMNVRTVEDAAKMNDDAMRMIGMGALDIKNKALAHLQASKDTGPVVMENAQLKARVEVAEATVAQLTSAVEALQAQLKTVLNQAPQSPQSAPVQKAEAISLADVQSDDDLAINDPVLAGQYEQRFGKLPHHRAKKSTIEAALRG